MNILIVSGHPDDAEFAIGGILLMLSKKHKLTQLVLTDGGAGTFNDVEKRKREQENASKMLGAKLVWLGKPDCSLEHTRNAAIELAQHIRDAKPDVIFAPYPELKGDIHDGRAHPDHRAAGRLVRDAARYARFNISELKGDKHDTKQVYWFMITPEEASVAIPIDSVTEELQQLMKCHESQLQLRKSSVGEMLLQFRKNAAMRYRTAQYVEMLATDLPLLVDAEKLF